MNENDNRKSNIEERGVCGPRPALSQYTYIFKCKPTYNFQSVEFEFAGTIDNLDEMFELYKAIVNGLMALAPEQPTKVSGPAPELASAKQREIMDKFHIKYKSSITKAEAQELIKKSLESVNN